MKLLVDDSVPSNDSTYNTCLHEYLATIIEIYGS